MGLLHALGRLWPGSTARDRRVMTSGTPRVPSAARPVAIDLHTPDPGEDVASIDRDLAARRGAPGGVEVLDQRLIGGDSRPGATR